MRRAVGDVDLVDLEFGVHAKGYASREISFAIQVQLNLGVEIGPAIAPALILRNRTFQCVPSTLDFALAPVLVHMC